MKRQQKYVLTDEHRAQLPAWRARWIANAMSTAAMTEADREICRDAVERLYRAANLMPPPRHRIVFVPSPFVARFAGGFATWIWHRRRGSAATRAATDAATYDATDDATYAATRAATYTATRAATYDATDDATRAATYTATRAATDDATHTATYAATRAATYDATYDATDDATYAATRAATYDATDDATHTATRDATYDATDDATHAATGAATDNSKTLGKWYRITGNITACANTLGVGHAGLLCAQKAYALYQGGNFWSPTDAFLSFFRHVVQLPIDYEKWAPWETLSLHSSWRIVHREFCIISDRPERLLVDELNRPHCDDGPFCQWRDGSALYSVHGVRTPGWIIEQPNLITPSRINAETNVEVRRVMLDRYRRGAAIHGAAAYLRDSHAIRLDHDERYGTLWRQEMPDDEPLVMIELVNRTPEASGEFRHYFERVPPTMTSAREAHNWRRGFQPSLILNAQES